ncbi:uncharacterized protein LOC135467537 [Liolophura sinensis]|uniref:uncharacterized protein LOC135467537 n=1 Tax=Liolophura sinensis TaxID=3198878 RepID=UPI00315840CC
MSELVCHYRVEYTWDVVDAGELRVVAETSSINIQEGFPEELHVSLYIDDNRPMHMRLKRSSTLDSNVPLFVICNGSLFEKNGTNDLAAQFYQDIDTGAAIELSCDNSTEECIPSLRGSFYQDKILYELSPFVENDTLAISHIKKRSTDSHQVVQRTDQDGNEIFQAPMSVRFTVEVRKMSQRSKRSYKEPRCVELVAVISYDIFNRWYKLSPHFDKTARENDALFNIRRYFAMVVQGVDLRYSSIITIDFSLCVKLSAYVIATTKRDSPWTETKNVGGAVDGADVLPFFRTWSIHNGGKIGPYDHIQLFTGYDVKTGGDTSAVGLSYISSICLKSWAVSIVEDNQDMMHTTTASTHEIGHRYGIDCISDKPRLLGDRQWKSYTRNLPGQLYPPDQQCRLMHGDTSFMSRKLLQERWCIDGKCQVNATAPFMNGKY